MDGVVEIITERERRRQRSTADKLRIVVSFRPGPRMLVEAISKLITQELCRRMGDG